MWEGNEIWKKIFHLFHNYLVTLIKREIFQIFVAFSEYLNFMIETRFFCRNLYTLHRGKYEIEKEHRECNFINAFLASFCTILPRTWYIVEIKISFFPIVMASLGFWVRFDFEKIPDLQNAARFLSLLWSHNLLYRV